jgi:hypothetical protein
VRVHGHQRGDGGQALCAAGRERKREREMDRETG